ncbi:MAG: M1 family metallopeptidase [Anaerolineales bacterium]|nr:M1 family metallopeptidase [Anaerolineales bacterium]MCB9146147.1 M1 family metallopeptidase [Anaerolineales bacterium]
MQNNKKTILSLLAIIFILSACSTPQGTASPTNTEQAFVELPATNTPAQPTETPLPTNTPLPVLERAKYTLNTTIDYDAKTIAVDQTILYPNLTGNQLTALVIAVVPNLWDGSFTLNSLAVDGQPVTNYTLNEQRLDIPLVSMLPVNAMVEIKIQYSLNLPFAEQEDPSVSRPRIYGYTSRQLNLVNWYPFVVPNINGEWILHDPWYYGEHLVYDSADYEVNLSFTPSGLTPIVASSGVPEPQADGSTRYTITSARTFALAASRDFQTSSTQVGDVVLTSYYFPFNEAGGQGALQASAQALQVYSARFGAYPHKSLAIVMGDFNDGMEYSAFFYLSKDFYNLYDGTPANYLTFVAVHETAHQWWFEQVANDQALQPWLDETLATYSERVYYENTYPDLLSWWWSYRIDFYNPEGFVDIPIYEGQGFRTYTNAAYFQGAYFLEKVRQRIGDEAFYAFIQTYLSQGRGKIVTANDFFNLLRASSSTDISDLINQYFRSVYQ